MSGHSHVVHSLDARCDRIYDVYVAMHVLYNTTKQQQILVLTNNCVTHILLDVEDVEMVSFLLHVVDAAVMRLILLLIERRSMTSTTTTLLFVETYVMILLSLLVIYLTAIRKETKNPNDVLLFELSSCLRCRVVVGTTNEVQCVGC